MASAFQQELGFACLLVFSTLKLERGAHSGETGPLILRLTYSNSYSVI